MRAEVRDRPAAQAGTGFVARVRVLPVVSWIWPEHHSAEAGASCGLVGGACCVGGAAVKGLGLASAASVSSFIGGATPYFIGVSIVLMGGWLFWMARQVNFRPAALGRTVARHGVVMGSIYGMTLAATMGIASVADVSM